MLSGTIDKKLVWEAIPGAIGYDIEMCNAGHGAVEAAAVSDTNSIVLADIFAGTSIGHRIFLVHIRAKDALGPGDWSVNTEIEILPLRRPNTVEIQ